MEKEFNVTGNCRRDKHYVADISDKLGKVIKMVEKGNYFVINRPRQYGKTTMLYALSDMLRKTGDYIVFNISFEGISDNNFEDEAFFVPNFIRLLAKSIRRYEPDISAAFLASADTITNIDLLSDFITDFTESTHRKVVLMIDEVDKSSNSQLFVSFLAMLRNKYLAQEEAKTFHSVVLAGLHDIKSLKIKLHSDFPPDNRGNEQKYNSSWNIATAFTVDMNLQPDEIRPMLQEYAHDKGIKMDAHAMADRLFYYTSGYPFLVSKLCKIMDENMPGSWTEEGIEAATQQLIKENNTNFESLAKNLENSEELYRLVYNIAIDGATILYNPLDPIINFALLYGIVVNKNGALAIQNRIYAEVLVDYMIARMQRIQLAKQMDIGIGYVNPDKTLNMELVLTKFQAFMREQYSKNDRDFLERNGRLVFLAFLKPIINGSGYEFKEPQISDERRLDVVITYFQHKYVAELKIWHGAVTHQKGLSQLADYLDRLALNHGFLLIFDHSKKKTWKSAWTTVEGKGIFQVWV